jgi:hypothetical protein
MERASGWPLCALRCDVVLTSSGVEPASSVAGGIRVQSGMNHAQRHELAVLPMTPIWPGFAIESLAFSAAWFLLLSAPRIVRGCVRRRGNCCVACGYDLHGLLSDRCPECGTFR